MASSAEYPKFSSTVHLELRAEGRQFELAAIGPHEIYPREPLDLGVCDAEIVMDVDGKRFLWRVRLRNGAVPFDKVVPTDALGDVERLGA